MVNRRIADERVDKNRYIFRTIITKSCDDYNMFDIYFFISFVYELLPRANSSITTLFSIFAYRKIWTLIFAFEFVFANNLRLNVCNYQFRHSNVIYYGLYFRLCFEKKDGSSVGTKEIIFNFQCFQPYPKKQNKKVTVTESASKRPLRRGGMVLTNYQSVLSYCIVRRSNWSGLEFSADVLLLNARSEKLDRRPSIRLSVSNYEQYSQTYGIVKTRLVFWSRSEIKIREN